MVAAIDVGAGDASNPAALAAGIAWHWKNEGEPRTPLDEAAIVGIESCRKPKIKTTTVVRR